MVDPLPYLLAMTLLSVLGVERRNALRRVIEVLVILNILVGNALFVLELCLLWKNSTLLLLGINCCHD